MMRSNTSPTPRASKKKSEVHTRRLWIIEGEEVAHIGAAVGFPGIEMILRIDLEVSVGGVIASRETRHLITSLKADEVSPVRLMELVRGHWSVENGLHFLKDRWWGRGSPMEHAARAGGAAGDAARLRVDGTATSSRIQRKHADPSASGSPGTEDPQSPQVHRSRQLETLQSSWIGAGDR